jgi:hypothetical protein
VFSLGSNGQCGFERDIRARYPHCRIEVYDPTIKVGTARKVERLTEVRICLDEGRAATERGVKLRWTIGIECKA